jgi:hypothetical protein
MQHTLLSDAALALSRILTFHRVHHGFFGGFAILSTTTSPSRETKDLDVLVSATKSTITSLLSRRSNWLEIPQNREDYIAYFYRSPSVSSASSLLSSDDEDGDDATMVLVEMFVGHQAERFPVSKNCVLRGKRMGVSYVPILSEEYLFRGKLNAAATRGKKGDMEDLKYLVEKYGKIIKERGLDGLDKRVVKEAVQRHPELKAVLAKVGIKTGGRLRWVKRNEEAVVGNRPAGVWDVHRGLGWAA